MGRLGGVAGQARGGCGTGGVRRGVVVGQVGSGRGVSPMEGVRRKGVADKICRGGQGNRALGQAGQDQTETRAEQKQDGNAGKQGTGQAGNRGRDR